MNVEKENYKNKIIARDYDFIRRVASINIKAILDELKINRTRFYKGNLSEEEINILKNKIMDYIIYD